MDFLIILDIGNNDEFEEMEYEVRHVDQETVVSRRMHREESMQDIVNDAEKRIEQIIYEFVYNLALSGTERGTERRLLPTLPL